MLGAHMPTDVTTVVHMHIGELVHYLHISCGSITLPSSHLCTYIKPRFQLLRRGRCSCGTLDVMSLQTSKLAGVGGGKAWEQTSTKISMPTYMYNPGKETNGTGCAINIHSCTFRPSLRLFFRGFKDMYGRREALGTRPLVSLTIHMYMYHVPVHTCACVYYTSKLE